MKTSATITAHPHEAPVAWRVKNDFGHWYVTQDKALADTYRDTENKDVQPLYLAAPVDGEGWLHLKAKRVLSVDRGQTTVLCDRDIPTELLVLVDRHPTDDILWSASDRQTRIRP